MNPQVKVSLLIIKHDYDPNKSLFVLKKLANGTLVIPEETLYEGCGSAQLARGVWTKLTNIRDIHIPFIKQVNFFETLYKLVLSYVIVVPEKIELASDDVAWYNIEAVKNNMSHAHLEILKTCLWSI